MYKKINNPNLPLVKPKKFDDKCKLNKGSDTYMFKGLCKGSFSKC